MTAATAAVAPTKQRSFLGQFLRAVGRSIIHAPLAGLLAVASLVPLFVVGIGFRLLDLPDEAKDGPVAAWLVLSHALFMTFMSGFIGPERVSLVRRLLAGLLGAWRGCLPLTPLVALAWGLLIVPVKFGMTQPIWSWLALGVWAVSTFLALPMHFARFSWSGWMRTPQLAALPAWQRVMLMLPSVLFLSVGVWLFSQPGLDMGIMDGGAIMMPILGAMIFWASYSCALFSAQFAP